VSFDGGTRQPAAFEEPDCQPQVERDRSELPRIARGGGYSYAAASFGAGSVVLKMGLLRRVLAFDPANRTIEVEAGATLEEILAFTAPRGLWLPVQPGYPAITAGGCIAANVHGKNPLRDGTFLGSVASMKLFHPHRGTVSSDRTEEPELFELTCGGYGLTGIILSAVLRLERLPGPRAAVRRAPIGSLAEGLARLRASTPRVEFAYTWHDGTPSHRSFGRGFVYEGEIPESPPEDRLVRRYRPVDPTGRGGLVVPIWGRLTGRLLTSGFRHLEAARPENAELPLFEALFPFARRGIYFRLFGRRGLVEFQAIVPHAHADDFLRELARKIFTHRAPALMISMKLFRGTPKLLRFEGDGVCVTLDLPRSRAALAFLPVLDDLLVAVGGIPNIIKDSRLPRSVVRKSYPEYDAFREKLRIHDPVRIFRSELSERLGL
jgi:decaprenylphospho-beta-D-ribofuranose 2-oxidase